MGEGRRKRRRRVEPTDDWKQLKLLFGWPEQVRYEELRPLVLFGSSVAERAIEIEAAERTLYRRMDRFETEGMESLFDSETARHRKLGRNSQYLLRRLRQEAQQTHREAHPRRGAYAPQNGQTLRSLPRDRRAYGAQDGCGEAALRRVSSEEHRRVPRDA